MREIKAGAIRDAVAELAQKANFMLRSDVRDALEGMLYQETNHRAKKILLAILENARIAKRQSLAICQDTGLPVVFAEIGQEVRIIGGSLQKAIQAGIKQGYAKGNLRNSIILDPILRSSPGFIPAVIHTEIISGKKVKLTVLPKGFGCENKGQVKMFNPTVSIHEIRSFIVSVVKNAGPDACPPFVVGVGIGGTQDYACLLAKKALLKKVTPDASVGTGRLPRRNATSLEKELLTEINRLNIGPMGLGGKSTCLGVSIETYPTHIAGLPVAVNISCHALRSARAVL